jgi:hypothetical protein
MSLGTYGTSPAAPRPRSFGTGLSGMAESSEGEAFGLARSAAQNETSLNLAKDRHKAEQQAGASQLGALAGAQVGGMFGPWGALAGGILGGLLAAKA